LNSNDELVKFLKRQIEIEIKIVSSLNGALSKIENPAVKGVLKGISLDSAKHAEMYDAAIKLLSGATPALSQEQLDEQKELVQKHIRIESELIERLENVLKNIDDEKVRLLLNAILSDERRHHELLKKVLEIIVRGETITEEDWWDVLWRDVPYHGAPGG
jgi:rubrerythrin